MQEPINLLVATALAAQSTGPLYELVRKKFGDEPESIAALNAVDGAPPDSPAVHRLSEELRNAQQADPYFAAELRGSWAHESAAQEARYGVSSNHIGSTINGKFVQVRDIEGGVNIG